MRREISYLLIGGLAVAVAVLGYLYYQEQQSGARIEIDVPGVKVDVN